MSDKDSPIVEAMKDNSKIELCYKDCTMWYNCFKLWIVKRKGLICPLYQGTDEAVAVKALKGEKR